MLVSHRTLLRNSTLTHAGGWTDDYRGWLPAITAGAVRSSRRSEPVWETVGLDDIGKVGRLASVITVTRGISSRVLVASVVKRRRR